MTTWVIGQGGLLGNAIASRVRNPYLSYSVPWEDEHQARRTLQHQYELFRKFIGHKPWTIVWAAGSATIADSPQTEDIGYLSTLLNSLQFNPPSGAGVFFLASSAGGVFGGSSDSPFHADTTPKPISAYGRLKLLEETATIKALQGLVPTVIGRIANLYGPRQKRGKRQGLVTSLCLSSIERKPTSIFVPLQTQRDWISSDDAASVILSLCNQARGGSPIPTVHVIASGIPTTVGRLIRTVKEVTNRPVPVVYGMDASAANQPFDLRLRPGPEVTQAMGSPTSLPLGIRRLFDYLSVHG